MNLSERRPLASREQRWAQAAARVLARQGLTPNAISIAGMIAGILSGVALALTTRPGLEAVGFVTGAVLIQLRLLANLLDGMVAAEQQTASRIGELYNEVPDRVSDVATFVGAGFAVGSDLNLGYVAGCLAVFLAYVRVQGRVAGAPQHFCGPMAKPHRMATVTVASLYAGIAPAGWQPVVALPAQWGTDAGWSTMGIALVIVIAGEIVTLFRRLTWIASALRRIEE